MEERQVTVDGRAHPAPRPFLVMATQNPVEMDGTYPLPEAQLDRFLLKTTVGYPDLDAEVRVLRAHHHGHGLGSVDQVTTAEDVRRLIALAGRVHVSDAVMTYIAELVQFTRSMPQVRLGASPRGAVGLLRTCRVRAALGGRTFVVPGDVQALAEPVLGHRLLLAPAYEAAGGTSADAVRELVAHVAAPPRG
jgi:MoxR-like ATPase